MMNAKVQITLCVLSFMVCVRSQTVNLFGADPAGGLWGARVDTSAGGEASTHDTFGYKSNVFNKYINIATYDSVTGKVLFETSMPNELYYGPLCASNRKSPRFLQATGVVNLADPQMGDCVNCETSAFAMHNEKVYFLYYGEYMSTSSVSRVVQIRMFKPCNRCGDTGNKFSDEFTYKDAVRCSKVVVDVIKETYEFNEYDNMEVKGGKSMKVVPEGDHLSFFFQLGNITRFDSSADIVSISLWHASTDGSIAQLNTEHLDSRYSSWEMRAFGSVDARDKTVCWTTGDRLYCGDFENNMLTTKRLLISPGDVAANSVCQGPELNRTAVVSGVAIIEGGDYPKLAFGCYPQSSGTGGTGMLIVTKNKVAMHPIGTRDGGPLLAGSVFITSGFDEGCTWSPEPQICLGQPRPTPAGATRSPGDDNQPGDDDDNIAVDEGNENQKPDENGIEGGKDPNKVPEEGSPVIGSSTDSANVCVSSVVSLLSIFVVLIFS